MVKVKLKIGLEGRRQKHVVLPLGRVPSYYRKFRQSHRLNGFLGWEFLDEPTPEDFVKLVAMMKALGDQTWV
jgi:hypothetical protein